MLTINEASRGQSVSTVTKSSILFKNEALDVVASRCNHNVGLFSEKAITATKAALMNDINAFLALMAADSPEECKARFKWIGRTPHNGASQSFRCCIWYDVESLDDGETISR